MSAGILPHRRAAGVAVGWHPARARPGQEVRRGTGGRALAISRQQQVAQKEHKIHDQPCLDDGWDEHEDLNDIFSTVSERENDRRARRAVFSFDRWTSHRSTRWGIGGRQPVVS